MNRWIIGLLLLGIVTPLVNCEADYYDEYDDYEAVRQNENAEASAAEPAEEDMPMPIVVGSEDVNQQPTSLLIRDSDLNGNVGVLVIQNGVAPNKPVLFELRPVVQDNSGTYFVNDEEDSPMGDDKEDALDTVDNSNRYKPSIGDDVDYDADSDSNSDSDLDWDDEEEITPPKRRGRPTQKPYRKPDSGSNSDSDLDLDDNEELTPPKRRGRPTQKPKRKPDPDSNSDAELDSEDDEEITPPKRRGRPTQKPKRKPLKESAASNPEDVRPAKKRKPAAVSPTRRIKRKKNKNGSENDNNNNDDNNNDKDKNKDKKKLKKRKRKGPSANSLRRKENYQNNNIYRLGDNKKRINANTRKGNFENTVSNTVTTTQTSPAKDDNVNYIIINKQTTPAPTTARPFWNILGRSAVNQETDRSLRPRKRLHSLHRTVFA